VDGAAVTAARGLVFDPGLARCGAVVVDTDGMTHRCIQAAVFRSESRAAKLGVEVADDRVRRVREFCVWLSVLFDSGPTFVAAEAMSFPRGAHAISAICLAWGALVSEVERRQVPFVATAPIAWRRHLTATGGEQDSWRVALARVPSFVDRARGIVRADQEHVLDALGVFCWSLSTNVVRALLQAARPSTPARFARRTA
jgi:Holliday junction resolvasome RuvABC endonuclease subunit